jgi:tRNA-dihydrouridine synthase
LLAPPTILERVAAAKQHLTDSLAWKGPKLGVLEMRRHYAPYFKGLPDIKPYRARLVTEMEPSILFETLEEIETVYSNLDFTLSHEPMAIDVNEVCDG